MTNAKPFTNNKEKAKAKMKKDPLAVSLKKLQKLKYEEETLSGTDLAAYADALAGAKIAMDAIKKTIEDAESILKAAVLRHYCDHYAKTGRPPDIRRLESNLGSFQAVQQRVAKVTVDKAEELKKQGIDLSEYNEKTSYTIRMSSASKEATKKIVEDMRKTLGDDYDNVVSEYVSVGEKFFDEFDKIVRNSLGPDQKLDEKMLSVLRILNPTISFRGFSTDLRETSGYDLALTFAKQSAERKKASKEAARRAKEEAAEEAFRRDGK